MTTERILVLSFTSIICVGTFLLMLPLATNGEPLGFINSLFTATSATCVTGLIVVDTGTKFTLFGQTIIIMLIQLGGLGIMTFSIGFLYLFERRFTLGSRDLLLKTLSHDRMPNIASLLKTVFLSTCVIEGIGSVFLTLRFLCDMPLPQAVYHGIFHAVSAFCNAGFALNSDSMTAYQNDIVINLTMFLLIVFGGLGFIVMYEFPKIRHFDLRNLSFHSRLVLFTTGILISGGAILFFTLESQNSIENLPLRTKLLVSLFQSVTTRTAGFNTIDISALSNPTLFIFIILMFIGASPGSCGGGIKTTTFAILMAFIRSRFHSHSDVNLLYRRIASETVSRSISIAFFFVVCIVVCTLLLLITESAGLSHFESRGLSIELLFEVTSAFATVGLSVGATPNLSAAGKILIVLMMFIGRLGPLTIAMTMSRQHKIRYKYAQVKVLVG